MCVATLSAQQTKKSVEPTEIAGAAEDAADAKSKLTYTPDEIKVFKKTPQGDLNVRIFYPDGEAKAGAAYPAIVHFYGGGWAGFNVTQFYQQSAYYAEHGIVSICADYRVLSKHKITTVECIVDAKSAVRWARENAEALGIDPNRIAVCGSSSGGHLAAATAIIEGYEDENDNLEVSSKPNAMLLFNAVLDTTENGCGASRFPGRETVSSANHNIHEGIVPALVLHGTADTTTPFVNATDFKAAMDAHGNICELIPFEGAGHGFFNGSQHREKSDNVNFYRCVEASVEFLDKYMK